MENCNQAPAELEFESPQRLPETSCPPATTGVVLDAVRPHRTFCSDPVRPLDPSTVGNYPVGTRERWLCY